MAQKQAGSEFLSVPQIRSRRILNSDTLSASINVRRSGLRRGRDQLRPLVDSGRGRTELPPPDGPAPGVSEP